MWLATFIYRYSYRSRSRSVWLHHYGVITLSENESDKQKYPMISLDQDSFSDVISYLYLSLFVSLLFSLSVITP